MARKILGQVASEASTEEDLYEVPAGKQATVSSLVICNRGALETTFRVSCSASGGSTGTQDYIYYGLALGGNDTFIATIGGTLSATDVIRVWAGNANLSFTAFGDES